MIGYDLLTHAIGWGGTLCCVAAYQFSSSRKLVFCELLCALLYTVHYFMLGAYTGSLTMVLSLFANAVSCGNKAWMRRRVWPAGFLVMFLVSAAVTWEGWLSLLPSVATVLTCTANFIRNGKLIRLNRLCLVCPMWMVYNICSHSWSGMACELMVAGSILLSVFRYGLKSLDRMN